MRRLISLFAGFVMLTTGHAQLATQTLQLRNGWNSIWFEVEPTNTVAEVVFSGLPIASLWTYVAKDATIEFIQQQTEAMFNEPGWLSFFPPGTPEAMLTTLFSVHSHRGYLVRLTNIATLTVTGVPGVRPANWVADSFNHRGFPVNPVNLPTFGAFFGPADAHAGQPVYQLQPNGEWQLVSAGTSMKHGEAYWAYCKGASSYQGPAAIELEFGEGLNYGTVLTELVPRIRNVSDSAATVCIRDIFNGANNPLSYQQFANNRLNWINLPAQYCLSLGPGEVIDLRLAIRRTAFTGNAFASILEVTNNSGTRYLVPVTAGKLLPARPSLTGTAGAGNPAAGLWIGAATITHVNEANSSLPSKLTPTRSPFDLRLLVHVDASGKASLLKEVTQMWQNGTTTNDVNGRAVTDRPGRFVLLTDDSLIPQYRGASLRDGTPVGRRISTVDFDFEGGSSNVLGMAGAFGVGGTNHCTITLSPEHPTNPFKHRFHPDHDNVDASFQSYKEEAYRITRHIQLHYSPTDPAGTNTIAALDYGYNVIGGTYRENISGLHRANILSEGTFRLTRVANSPVLNQ